MQFLTMLFLLILLKTYDMTIRAFALCNVLRCPPPLSDCPHCFSIHCRESPPLLSRVCPNPHPCLMLSFRPLLLRHYHLPSTLIASSPPPAATTISCVLPISPLRLLRPRYRLLCIVSSTPPSHLAPVPTPPHLVLPWSPTPQKLKHHPH